MTDIRRDTLEEAARVVEGLPRPGIPGLMPSAMPKVAAAFAAAIRSLPSPTETEAKP